MIYKKLFNFRLKFKILLLLQYFKKFRHFNIQQIDQNKSQAYIFLAADYGNLGDLAITYAQCKFIEQHSNYQVIEIPISKSLEGIRFVKKHIKKNDLITTIGGGNLGDLYEQIEIIRQFIIKLFPNNKIISFPQTFTFSFTKKGYKALKIAKKIYNSHSNIHLIARDKTSFDLMTLHFNKAVIYLIPDIVLSLNNQISLNTRNGVVICMRNDKEKKLSKIQSKYILDIIDRNFENKSYYDTHINRNEISLEERIFELNKIWSTFSSAELVVTDRLHGMIFCYITNTPCLVFQNNNHKIAETYDWFNENSNIYLIKKFNKKTISDFFKTKNYKKIKHSSKIHHKFKLIKELLN